MKKLYIAYTLIWILICLLYILSCFDVCGDRIYSVVEMATWPWSRFIGPLGDSLETKYGFSLAIFILRLFMEVGIPAFFDLIVLTTFVRAFRRFISD